MLNGPLLLRCFDSVQINQQPLMFQFGQQKDIAPAVAFITVAACFGRRSQQLLVLTKAGKYLPAHGLRVWCALPACDSLCHVVWLAFLIVLPLAK